MDNIAASIIGSLAAALIFCTFAGGYFLQTACWLFNRWSATRLRPSAGESAPQEQVFKTTEAGPYTAPGVETPGVDPKSVDAGVPADAIALPSYAYACLISFCVSIPVAASAFGSLLLVYPYHPGYAVLPAILAAVFLATAIHTLMLWTNPLRGMILTAMLCVPWGAIWIATMAICFNPPSRAPTPPPASGAPQKVMNMEKHPSWWTVVGK